MKKISDSPHDVQHPPTVVPSGAPPSGPVTRDGSPAPAGAPAAARVIWKFSLDPAGNGRPTEMPAGAEILCVHAPYDIAFVWAICDPAQPKVERNIRVVATGEPARVRENDYVGTLRFSNGLVFHVFDCGEVQ